MREQRYFPSDWVWLALLGLGLVASGLVACLVATTWVILPYDVALTGLSPSRLAAINPHLLAFMAHDRVAFGGTLVSTGLLYVALAARGVRERATWALNALVISAAAGFASFFLWLGFDYFDPVHALATGAIFVCFALGLYPNRRHLILRARALLQLRLRRLRGLRLADVARSRRPGQWLFILIGGGIALAGLTIAVVGVTVVFVPEDLAFMQTTVAQLRAANPALVPLIAHDRAGFGGALLADGLGVLLAAWSGYARGARWLWWTFVAAGIPGFAAAIGVHLVVGYLNWWHLFPALVALGVYLAALAVAYPDLCSPVGPAPHLAHTTASSAGRTRPVAPLPGLGG
jgi:hypothetical protein